MVKIDIEEAGSPREVEEMDVRVNETVYRATPKLMMGPVESKQKSFLIKILILGVVLTFVSILVIISFGIPFNPPKPGFVNNLVMIFVQPLLLIVFSVGASIRKVAVYYGDKHKWTKVQIVKFYGAIMMFIWVPMALVVTFSGFYPLTIYFIYIIAASFGTELLKRSPIVFSAETRKNPEWKEFFSYHTRDSNYIAAGSIVYTGYFLAYSALTKYIAAQIALSVVNFAIFTLAKQQFILGHKAIRPMVVYNYFIFVGFSHTYTIFLFPFLESDLVFAALAFIQVFGSLAPLIFLFPRPVLLMRLFLNKHVKKFKDVYPDPNDVHGYAKHRREVVEEFCFNNLSFLVGVVGYLTISSSIRYTWNQPYFAFGIVTHQAYLQSIYYCWILGGIMVVTFFIVSIIINYKLGLNVWTLLFDVMGVHWDLWAIGYFTIFLNVMWILQKHYHIWYWMRKEEGVAFTN